jgi:hypothetical protein
MFLNKGSHFVEAGKTYDEHGAYYKKFFIISDTLKRGRKYGITN